MQTLACLTMTSRQYNRSNKYSIICQRILAYATACGCSLFIAPEFKPPISMHVSNSP